MHMRFLSIQISPRKAASYFVLCGLFAFAAAAVQVSIAADAGLDSSGNYEQERAWCMTNTQGDDRVACLKESGAARAEKRDGTLNNKGANFYANSMQRCEALSGEDRAACKARMMGFGSASGSVQGGGIIRQVETVVPAQAQSPGFINQTPK
jgi:hypothetical protein